MPPVKKTIAVLAFLLLIAGIATAYTIEKKELTIKIDESGNGTFNEKYYFAFFDRQDLDEFLKVVTENGQDLLKWQASSTPIVPYFSSIEKLSLKEFSFNQAKQVLELEYSAEEKSSVKILEDQRSSVWRLNQSLLQKFEQGTIMEVPRDITISIELPANSELKTELLPQVLLAKATKNTLSLNNVRVNNLNIQYVIPKPIAQTVSLTELLNWLNSTGLIYALIAAIIVLGAIIAVKRKSISERIENYIVEHSEISRKEEEEEIEIEE
ncbi:MAG: hypothetical protein J4478_04430 [Candidatus Diapherotrites archaeon]|uniref:Uncharacterized protein n=3 Tax=Candidatus Iainarchaeum sp. TaxID=3101447 RepID=A0A8T4KZK8_9ARCH|nr:hypothetical protein [Candidatus Diapherotrites archaeon]